MCNTVQIVCRRCHGTGNHWVYRGITSEMVVCYSCNGSGRLFKPENEVLKEQVIGLTLERERAIAIINDMLYELKTKDKILWDQYMGILIDLNNDIYEREHPEEEVPW